MENAIGFQSEVCAAAMRKLEDIGQDKTWVQEQRPAGNCKETWQNGRARVRNAA
jgi:hypothetical protein